MRCRPQRAGLRRVRAVHAIAAVLLAAALVAAPAAAAPLAAPRLSGVKLDEVPAHVHDFIDRSLLAMGSPADVAASLSNAMGQVAMWTPPAEAAGLLDSNAETGSLGRARSSRTAVAPAVTAAVGGGDQQESAVEPGAAAAPAPAELASGAAQPATPAVQPPAEQELQQSGGQERAEDSPQHHQQQQQQDQKQQVQAPLAEQERAALGLQPPPGADAGAHRHPMYTAPASRARRLARRMGP